MHIDTTTVTRQEDVQKMRSTQAKVGSIIVLKHRFSQIHAHTHTLARIVHTMLIFAMSVSLYRYIL